MNQTTSEDDIQEKWSQLRQRELELFSQLGFQSVKEVFDEAAFRSRFSKMCTELGEYNGEQLYSYLQGAFVDMAGLLVVLRMQNLTDSAGNNQLQFWGTWSAILEAWAGEEDRQSFEVLVQWIFGIARAIPDIQQLPGGWESVGAIQGHLQEIYKTVMDTSLFVVLSIKNDDSIPEIRRSEAQISISQYIQGSQNVMTIAKTFIHEFDIPVSMRRSNATIESPTGILDYSMQYPRDPRGRWEFERDIAGSVAEGAYGTVNVKRVRSSQIEFACKTMKATNNNFGLSTAEHERRQAAVVREEVMIMQKLRRHCHITTIYFQATDEPEHPNGKYKSLHIFMRPVANRDLKEFLRKEGKNRVTEAMKTLLQNWIPCLISALAFAHSKEIKHKDIKPANILVVDDRDIYLTDFGCSVDFADLGHSYSLNTFQGTRKYQAPEADKGISHGRKADVFGMGCVFAEMLTISLDKTLASFEARRTHSFYWKDVPSVQEWLKTLMENQDEKSKLLLRTTMKMLEPNQDVRQDSASILGILETEGNLKCSCAKPDSWEIR